MTEPRVVPFLVSELRLPLQEQAVLGREWWPSYAHAVIHRDGVFLFDNGSGNGNAEDEAMFSPRVTPIEEALAGQALQSRAEWERATEPSASGEPGEPDRREAYAASVRRLRVLEPVRVHFAHDPAVWERG